MPAYPDIYDSGPGTFPGSSGYGSPIIKNLRNPPLADFPTYGPGGLIVSNNTKQPYTGTYNGQTYKSGQLVDKATGKTQDELLAIQNDPSQRYKAVEVVKSPAVASATDELMKRFNDSASNALKDFNEHLNTFKGATADAFKRSQSATDIAPYESAVRGFQSRYDTGLGDTANRYANLLEESGAAQRGIVDEAEGMLPMYDTAAQNVADRQMAEVRRQLSRYKMAGGTPRSLGSDEMRILARGAADVQLPTELAKVGRRFDILNNLKLPVERDITGRGTQYFGSFLPQIQQQQYGSGTAMEGAIQQLKMQVAQMSFEDAMRYMQSAGVPWQIQQQILGGQASILGGIGQLEDQSRYRGLQDILGVNVSQPQYFSQANPTFSGGGGGMGARYFNATSPAVSTRTATLTAPNAPRAIAPQVAPALPPGTGIQPGWPSRYTPMDQLFDSAYPVNPETAYA